MNYTTLAGNLVPSEIIQSIIRQEGEGVCSGQEIAEGLLVGVVETLAEVDEVLAHCYSEISQQEAQ